MPEPGPGEALVKVEAVGICASDLKCYHGAAKFWGDENRPAWAETEVIPGHEFVGRVVELDDEAAARWGIAVGDRVVAEQIVPCWTCRYCLRGAVPHVRPARHLRLQARAPPARWPRYMVFPADALVHKVSADLPPRTPRSPSRCPAPCTPSSAPGSTFDDVVVVAGCGPIGLGMIAGAKAKYPGAGRRARPRRRQARHRRGVRRRRRDQHRRREDASRAVKELTGGYGADVYLEGTGHPSAVGQGLNLLRKLGRYVEYSVFGSDVTVDWSIISDDKELDVLGAHLGPHCWPAAIRMIESGRAADGPDLHPPAAAGRLPARPRPGRRAATSRSRSR